MPWSTLATFGAVSAIRWLTWSVPPAVYMSLQNVPVGERGLKQSSASPLKPMSLPPMPSVTIAVSAPSWSNCGGLGPGVTPCGWVMWLVFAPEQLGSRSVRPRRPWARCA
jgi:hypothetical protein